MKLITIAPTSTGSQVVVLQRTLDGILYFQVLLAGGGRKAPMVISTAMSLETATRTAQSYLDGGVR